MKIPTPTGAAAAPPVRLLLLLLAVGALSCPLACGDLDDASGAQAEAWQDAGEASFAQAQQALGEGHVRAARASFLEVEAVHPRYAQAQVGLAVAELMLLPEQPGTTALLEALGADPARLPLDVEADLYGAGGFFHRLSSAASPELVDEALREMLPWDGAALQSGAAAVFGGLDPALTLEALRPGVLTLEAELAAIEARLDGALAAGFAFYELPAGVLYSTRPYGLRRSELLVLRGMLGAGRAALHLGLAYAWPISLRGALAELDAGGAALGLEGVAALWNEGFARALDAERGLEHLLTAQALGVAAIESVREAHRVGREEARAGRAGALDWLVVDDPQAAEIDAFWADIAAGLGGEVPVSLRFALPELAFTAAPLFAGRLVREAGAAPLWVVVVEPGLAPWLDFDDTGLRQFAIEPLFEPGWSPAEPPDLFGLSSLQDGATTRAMSAFSRQLEADYNL